MLKPFETCYDIDIVEDYYKQFREYYDNVEKICLSFNTSLFFFLVPESEYPLDDLQKQCKSALCECDSEAANASLHQVLIVHV